MKWEKKGLVYTPLAQPGWANNSALTPTPILLGDIIRVYAGFRDEKGVSRIGYVDLSANDPSKVLAVSKNPVLDVGEEGAFDDNGVILGDVIVNGNDIWMYYVGFQLVEKVKFLAYTGLAKSTDGGESFERVQKTPILDRADEAMYIRAIHSVRVENGIWKVWYAVGSGWTYIDGVAYPQYKIKYIESNNGIDFPKEGRECVDCQGSEYRIGRPRVYMHNDEYYMFYTKGNTEREYFPGVAVSKDGIKWTRADELFGMTLSSEGWDSQTLCYPVLLEYKDKTYMFYNGNDMGKAGFGYAELRSWD